jgi:hypothetical protein
MATIYRIKPCKSDPNAVYIAFIRSKLTLNYALMVVDAMNGQRTASQLKDQVMFGVLEKDTDRQQFYHSLGVQDTAYSRN